jgi:hypothetical protein
MKIMFIRHGEKPSGSDFGVSPKGKNDKEDLTVTGWQRAGALARFFSPANPATMPAGLAVPTRIFAAAVNSASHSKRPQETVTPLSQLMGLKIDKKHGDGDEAALARAAVEAAADGPVLVAWQHGEIPCLISLVAGQPLAPKWPSTRFDLVWVLDSDDGTSWTFSQVPQMLIAGDVSTTVPGPAETNPCKPKAKARAA